MRTFLVLVLSGLSFVSISQADDADHLVYDALMVPAKPVATTPDSSKQLKAVGGIACTHNHSMAGVDAYRCVLPAGGPSDIDAESLYKSLDQKLARPAPTPFGSWLIFKRIAWLDCNTSGRHGIGSNPYADPVTVSYSCIINK